MDPEISKIQPNIIRQLLDITNHSVMRTWTNLEELFSRPYTLEEVDLNSAECLCVQTLWAKTARGVTIKKLERLQNPFLLAQFLLKKEAKFKKVRSVTEHLLFHGTNRSYVDAICSFNFDWRLRGKSRGYKFGQGVSFAPEVSYAFHYSNTNNMFLVRVLIHQQCTGSYETVIPPAGYDTTCNGPSTVVVKFEDAEFYPEYLIHY